MSASRLRQLAFLILLALPLAAEGQLGLHHTGIRFPDGTFLTSAGGNYAQIVVVARTGGHFSSIQSAIDSIDGASQLERYLVYVAPGIYNGQVRMKPWVDVQGAGENVTRMRYVGGETFPWATVTGSIHSELRDMKVSTSGREHTYGLGVYIGPKETDASLRRVRIEATHGIYNYGVYNSGSQAVMTDVEVEAGGGTYNYGVYNYSSGPDLWRVRALAWNGVNSYGVFAGNRSVVVIEGSILRGLGTAISRGVHVDSDSTVRLAHSRIDPRAAGWIGRYTCVGAYDKDFAALDDQCQ